MARYFIRLAYNGKNYHGWQSQHNSNTVQDELEKCFTLKIREKIRLSGCGRTDAGVHAREFYAHFDSSFEWDEQQNEALIHQLNHFLPSDIVVYEMFNVSETANARFDAISRTYHYHILRGKNPFLFDLSHFFYGTLNVVSMQKAADLLFDYHDFTSFSKLHTQTNNNLCTIYEANWLEENDQLVFRITANRFLRNMVRAIVGTLLEVGTEKLSLDGFKAVIEAKDRNLAGFSVPAKGLYLQKVSYPEKYFES
ncbi:MAG: tRNA pseudouridine(38-40) synthase TruA [Bacteroidetes bacterium HGW-Bacteroidetes-1]|jgi:tRNA pseudouridine38-40 synthase|nr:MAG: tRNA pseudouridine(38-40) synthase TruA [Bacteroidetes bacterium HGW-Bacteroidetes-1]